MWLSAPADLQIDSAFIDVWRTRIDLPKPEINKFAEILSTDEQERAEKFTFPDKYEEYVVTRGLLRKALSHVLNQSPADFKFDYTKARKPFLSEKLNGQDISFNVSHSHGQALVAISPGRQLGIDIEKIRPDVDYEKLAKRFFSAAEHEALMHCPVEDQVRAFFATWTRKEAFVKAVGKGIAFGLSEFDVNIDPREPPKMQATRWDANDVNKWHMASIETKNDYMASVVADGGEFQLRLWM